MVFNVEKNLWAVHEHFHRVLYLWKSTTGEGTYCDVLVNELQRLGLKCSKYFVGQGLTINGANMKRRLFLGFKKKNFWILNSRAFFYTMLHVIITIWFVAGHG